MEAERYKGEVRIAAMASPILCIAPQANANQVADLFMPLLRQEIRDQFGVMQGALQQRFVVMQAALREQLDDSRNETQQQFRIFQFNMGAMAFNSSVMILEAPIRALQKNAGKYPGSISRDSR